MNNQAKNLVPDSPESSANIPPKNSSYSPYSIFYDICMLIIISIDLMFIFIDNVLTSDMLKYFGLWLMNQINFSGIIDFVNLYNSKGYFELVNHTNISVVGVWFTLFLIGELVFRWIWAIINRHHTRWFFFPFIHWYEVIGCLPQFRLLRLLRAFVIGRRLYQLGYPVLPKKWIKSIHYYYKVILEEVSDRVLLTAVDNVRIQLHNSADSQALVKQTLENNRGNIEEMIMVMLRTELAPKLREELRPEGQESPIAVHVGYAVADAVAKTPELKKVLSSIPIAGSIIQSQIMGISEKIGYNIADSISHHLLQDEILDDVFVSIAHGIASINLDHPALEALVANIIEDSLSAFEIQVKNQQWQHQSELDNLHL